MKKQVVVRFVNETEGALRYREINDAGLPIHGDREGALVGDIYIRKMAITGEPPEQITVTLEYRN